MQAYFYSDPEDMIVDTSEGMGIVSPRELNEAEREVVGKIRVVDLTPILEARVAQYRAELGLVSGNMLVFDRHTTTALVINEQEEMHIEDIVASLLWQHPADAYYAHNDFPRRSDVRPDERKNAWAHLAAEHYPRGHWIPIIEEKSAGNGSLQLGRWQNMMYIDFDGPQLRELFLTVTYAKNSLG